MKFWTADRFRARGDAARDRGDWKRAARAYEQYLSRKPADAALWVQLGHSCKELGRLSAAQIAYQRALFLRPHDADLFVQIGHLHHRTGDASAAVAAYRRALELDPALAIARDALASWGAVDDDVQADEIFRLKKEVKHLLGRVALLEQALQEMAGREGEDSRTDFR